MISDVRHKTIKAKQVINAPATEVFSIWADPNARSVWGVPSDDEGFKFLKTDFQKGGKEIHLCGAKDDLSFRVETIYHEIIEPQYLLFSERVLNNNDVLCASLASVEFKEAGEYTNLEVTLHVTSLVGEEMIAGNQGGWEATLKNLERYIMAR